MTMNSHAILLCLCALALLGSMPFTFFRRGRFTAGWLLTAAPFFASAAVLLAALGSALQPLPLSAPLLAALSYAAVPLAALSIGLTAGTIGVHRAPVSMWHQDADQPNVLVTCGPYARIRHPFYASFIVMLLAITAAFPHVLTMLLLGAGVVQLSRTAAREERRLLASPLGSDYAAYMERTNRFVPKLTLTPRRARARSQSARRASIHPAS
jgi:protein-S-isoprenylcysteine O-methyltransferase Ste14